MDFVTTDDDVRLAYARRGSGRLVIACGGGPANDHRYLAEDLAAFEDDFEMVFHDYRGSGASERADVATYTLHRLGDDVEVLRTAVGPDRAVVLGHSFGGFVALEYALHHPEHCAGLVLAGTWPTSQARVMLAPTFRALGLGRTTKLAGRLVLWPLLYGWRARTTDAKRHAYAVWSTMQEGEPAARRAEAEREQRLGLPMDNDNVRVLQRELASWSVVGDLRGIQCPVLVVYGLRDAMAVAGAKWFQSLPSVEVHELDRVGHDPFFEAPERTLRAVREFVHDLT